MRGWIAADPLPEGVRVLITGPQEVERSVTFATDEDPVVIAQQVRETIDRQRTAEGGTMRFGVQKSDILNRLT